MPDSTGGAFGRKPQFDNMQQRIGAFVGAIRYVARRRTVILAAPVELSSVQCPLLAGESGFWNFPRFVLGLSPAAEMNESSKIEPPSRIFGLLVKAGFLPQRPQVSRNLGPQYVCRLQGRNYAPRAPRES